jgi:hypothetical protein
MVEKTIQESKSSRPEVGRASTRRGSTVIVSPDGAVYQVIRKSSAVNALPTPSEYMHEVDRFLNRLHDLTAGQRTMARALAKAVYRRAFAKRLRIDVNDTVQEAIAKARQALNGSQPTSVKRSTYAYQSESTGWSRRSRKGTPE